MKTFFDVMLKILVGVTTVVALVTLIYFGWKFLFVTFFILVLAFCFWGLGDAIVNGFMGSSERTDSRGPM